eukprot:201367_1
MTKTQETIECESDIESASDVSNDVQQMQDQLEFDLKNAMDDESVSDHDELPIFWSMKLVPNEEELIEEPHMIGHMIHITNACFGPNINKNTRTLVMVETSDDSEAAPICVLNEKNESAALDLLINDAAILHLAGTNVSEVYLTGYLVPEFNDESDDELSENYFDDGAFETDEESADEQNDE